MTRAPLAVFLALVLAACDPTEYATATPVGPEGCYLLAATARIGAASATVYDTWCPDEAPRATSPGDPAPAPDAGTPAPEASPACPAPEAPQVRYNPHNGKCYRLNHNRPTDAGEHGGWVLLPEDEAPCAPGTP